MKSQIALAAGLLFIACADQPQSNQAANAPQTSESNVDAVPASEPINAQLPQCQHAADASIYNRPASQWRVEQYGQSTLSLTVWRHKDGGNTQFSFYATQDGNTYRIDTVDGSPKVGEGTVDIITEGTATTFQIQGKDQSGNRVMARITCDQLVPLVAEGG